MGRICGCEAVALPSVGAKKCGVSYGQVQVAAFVKLSDLPAALFGSADVVDKSKWTAALAASPAKVTMSPVLYEWEDTPGGEVTWGEDQDADGIGYAVRVEPTAVTANLRRVEATVAAALGDMQCLAEAKDLGMVLFTVDGQVLGQETTSGLAPIPVYHLFVGDRVIGMRDEPDYHALSMQLPAGWSKSLKGLALNKVGSETQDWRGIDLLG